jgi:NADH-ubiquinone oxidoreductase chain 5
LVTAGVYLIIRFGDMFLGGKFRMMIFLLSSVTMFLAGVGAILENDMKKIIALSTLRQLGVIIMTISFGLYIVAFFHLLTHAMFKAILFLCAGAIIHGIGGIQDVRFLGVFGTISKFLIMMILLGRLSLRGFPFLRGFYSKDFLLEYIYIRNFYYVGGVLTFLGIFFTFIYSFRMIYYIILIDCNRLVILSFKES